MKEQLTKLLWPILKLFETDQEPENYKNSHRTILIVVGALFLMLSLGALLAAIVSNNMGGLLPTLVFLSVGFVALVVGSLGSDGAVAKIWSSK